ncbi:hypothetical protein SAMN05216364_100688 [Porphyromonadaceae bacterium KHP3R9]|nr:hypothetical protein SAMN05216364_100688 [Porphyromonadaceae bacterium KHP3R9]
MPRLDNIENDFRGYQNLITFFEKTGMSGFQ